MKNSHLSKKLAIATLSLAAFFSLDVAPARAQNLDYERTRGKEILEQLKRDITKNYYDPTFRGKDLDAIFSRA